MVDNAKTTLGFDVYVDDAKVASHSFTSESVTIGSGASALLRIEDGDLGELHAVINVNDDGAVQLLDLGDERGTKVNGEDANNALLATGDEIILGNIKIVLNIEFAEADAGPVAPADPSDDSATEQDAEIPLGGDDDLIKKEHITEISEDVMAFIMRSGSTRGQAGIDTKSPKVLEVAEIWGDVIMDLKHFHRGCEPITVGTSTGYRWRLVGLPMAWVPSGFAKVAWALAPTLSEAPEEWKNQFYAPPDNLPHDDYTLFEWKGTHFVANISDKWQGFLDIGEERHTFRDLIESGKAQSVGPNEYQIVIDEDTRVVADMGHVIFFGQMVHPGKRIVTALTDDLDYPFLGVMSLMACIFLMLVAVYLTSPPPPENEVMEIPDRFVELLLQQPEPEKKKKDKPKANEDAGEGAKAKKEEGKVGKKDAKMKKAKGNKVEIEKKQLDREVAEDAGVLGALRDGSELDGVFGSSNLNADLTGGIGGLIGAKGTQMGSGGLGSRGSGFGGGGTAEGLGGLGTKGRGSGASGYGAGGGNFGAKGEGGIGRIGGDPIILGALDKSLIDAVIKRHMNQIRYCYQRELTKSPTLGGKVTVKFVIAKDGSVSKASVKSTSMGNRAVESCITSRFMRFQFPEPKGGGIVIVSYPFIFAPG